MWLLNPPISHDMADIQVKSCNSARSISSKSFVVSKATTISASNLPIDNVDLSLITNDPGYLFVTCGGKVQIWNMLHQSPILLSVFDTKSSEISSSVYPVFDSLMGMVFLPKGSRCFKSVMLSCNTLPQLRLPAKAAAQLARYQVHQIPYLFYSLVIRLPKMLKAQYKTEYADVSTDKQLQHSVYLRSQGLKTQHFSRFFVLDFIVPISSF